MKLTLILLLLITSLMAVVGAFLTTSVTQDSSFDWGLAGMPPAKAIKMATTVVSTVPILLVYPFVQKYFTQGVMVGAVKG